MKLYALQLLLLAAVLAAPCTTVVCRASGGAGLPAKCNPLALRPCAAAVIYGARPSGECCAKVRELEPCLCDAVIMRTVVRAHPTPKRGDPCPPNCRAVRWTSRFADGPYLRDESSIRIVITVRK